MKHLAKRAFSLLLAALMVLSLIPAKTSHVHAAADTVLTFGFKDNTLYPDGLTMLTNSTHGTSQQPDYNTIAINPGKTLVMGLTADARNKFTQAAGYDGNVLLEVEYYIGEKLPNSNFKLSTNLTVKYTCNGSFVEATFVETKPGIEGTTTIAVYKLENTSLNQASYSGLSNAAFSVSNNEPSSKYLCVRSLKVVDPDSAPVFVTTDANYPDAFYDNQEFEEIKVGNEFRDKNIRVYGTVLINGEPTAVNNNKTYEGALAKRTPSLAVVTKTQLKSALSNNGVYQDGTYKLTIDMYWDSTDNKVSHEYTFTRKNTIQNELESVNNNVLYTATKLDAEHAPNKYSVTISGGDLTESIKVNITESLVFDENGVAQLDLTADQNLAPGTYTVKVETFFDEVQRTSNSITFEKCEHTNAPKNDCTAAVVCPDCNETIPAANETHNMKETATEVPAKCGEAGKKAVMSCDNEGCDYTTGGEEIPALEHDMKETAAEVPAKCGEAGTTAVYTCDNGCGTVTGGEEIKALEHDMKETAAEVPAKCGEAGKKAVMSCDNEGCDYTTGGEEIPALEHDMKETAAEVPAKCGEAGKKAVMSCDNEGCDYTTGGEEIPALEHDMQLTTAEVPAKCGEAGTTAVYTCANGCGTVTGGEEIKALEHAFDNDQDGTCNRCGFVRIVHAGSNVDLNNDLDVNIYVSLDETKIEEYTASISKGGQVVVEDAELVQNGTNVFQVTLPGVPAKELCEEITVTVRDSEGNEVITIVDSFAKYAQRALASESVSDEAKTMIVDMLNYAAAAQEHFGYKTDTLVNADLTDEQQALGTQNNPAVTNNYEKTNDYYYGTNFNLENNITMNMYVAGLGNEGYGIIKYTDHTGAAKEITINAADCTMSGSYYVFTIEEFVTADCARSEVYAEFYNGEDQLVVAVTDSMESYVARGAATYPWLYKMMKFVNSTLAYMNSKS